MILLLQRHNTVLTKLLPVHQKRKHFTMVLLWHAPYVFLQGGGEGGGGGGGGLGLVRDGHGGRRILLDLVVYGGRGDGGR
jgi:hypothetical protein